MKKCPVFYAYQMLMNAFRGKEMNLHAYTRALLRNSRFTKLKQAGNTAGHSPNVRGVLCAVGHDEMNYPGENAAKARDWIAWPA